MRERLDCRGSRVGKRFVCLFTIREEGTANHCNHNVVVSVAYITPVADRELANSECVQIRAFTLLTLALGCGNVNYVPIYASFI